MGKMSDEYKPQAGERSFLCADCGVAQHWLAGFPGGRCIDCHDVATRNQVVTAGELRRAFGMSR